MSKDKGTACKSGINHMNNIIWLVGAVVIVILLLGFFGLR